MNATHPLRIVLAALSLVLLAASSVPAAEPDKPAPEPDKVYVPYEKLKGVFDAEAQGVFLPYKDFQRLWEAARGAPAAVAAVPAPYLVSKADFTGKVGAELAEIRLELTVDILADGWVEVPVALGEVAVARAAFAEPDAKTPLLLRVVDGRYLLVTRGKGRRVLVLDFVRQLETQPGLNVLAFRIPPAAISKLDLLIPEENMKVDVAPMLAAATTQETVDGTKCTRLQTFLGAADSVRLSWKPTTQAAEDLAPVVISEQFQHINVAEALITHEVKFTYDIRRRGVDAFTIQLPGSFRVVAVEGANINKWDVAATDGAAGQTLSVKLFAPAKDRYELTVRMERFLQEAEARLPLEPILTREVLRRTGLIAVTHSPRRSVEIQNPKNLARVDAGRLPEALRNQPGVTVHRFITGDYGGELAIGTVAPRITVHQLWALGVDDDRVELRGRLAYAIERVGVFRLETQLPEPWEVVSVGPANLIDDHQLRGAGRDRVLQILLKQEVSGNVQVDLVARAPRTAPEADVNFDLPLADAANLQLYSGQLALFLTGRLRAEVAESNQLQPIPLDRRQGGPEIPGLSSAMAFEFRAVDRARPAGAKFRVAVRPAQVSAVVHRLVNIQAGSVEQEAVVQYNVLYAPVDTFYVKMPASLADAGVQISGKDIKEKPRLDKLPADAAEAPASQAASQPSSQAAGGPWAYYKIVLQSPVLGRYDLRATARRAFQAAGAGQTAEVPVEPILAAGRLSDQSGHIAVAKAETLAIVNPVTVGLDPADPSSATDLPHGPHRAVASLAFRYNRPPFELVLPVVVQKEAAVFTTIVSAAVVEQVLARDRRLSGHAIFLLATSKGDRLPLTLPRGAKLLAVLLNAAEVPVEAGATPEERIVRLPPSAGQVARMVLEVSYSLDQADASRLAAPSLPAEVPVQQTLWRLWVPDEEYLIHFDRVFSRLPAGSGNWLIQTLGQGWPSAVAFKLSPQGTCWDFVRQGAPGDLSVTLAGTEAFHIAVWAAVLVVGAAMLKLGGLQRCVLVLAALLAGAVLRLFAPLLVRDLAAAGVWAALLVAGLWAAQWLFLRLPRQLRKAAAASPPALPPPPPDDAPAKPASPPSDTPEKE